MAVRVIFSSLGHDGNMSRVRIAQGLELLCLNSSTPISPACDRSAQGISLSTPILMTTFAVVGNVLALIVLYSSRREAHARRTVFFVMLAGLAWTDLIGQFAVSPIAIITYANNLRWIGGAQLCRYHGFMMVSFGLVTPLIVCCMSVERLLAIKFSYYYAKHVTRRKAQVTFLASWCLTTLFTTLPFLGFGSYELQYPGSWCFLNFHRESHVDTVYAAMFSSFNIVAIIIMILCNFIVAATLFRMRRSRQLHSSPSNSRRISASGVGSTTSGTFIRARRHSDMEAQMIWFLCMITVAFSVCWLPLNVHILWMQFTGTTNRVLDLKFIRMASCNQILDPWLYVIFRKNSLLRIIRRLKACLKVVQQAPRHELTKPPNMRYVISNKSYTYEATSLGKTVLGGHCCLAAPKLTRHLVKEGCEDRRNNDCSQCNSDSVAQLMSGCSYCDRQCTSNSASNPMAEVSPWLSSHGSEVEHFAYDLSPKTPTFRTDYCGKQPKNSHLSCLEPTVHGMSEPLLVASSIKSKKTQSKCMKFLDVSLSSDSNGAYYSLDSKHKPPTVPAKHSKSRKSTLADSKHKSPFLGSSQNTSTPQSSSCHSHVNHPQQLRFSICNNFLLLPPTQSPSTTAASRCEINKSSIISPPSNIPLSLKNIPSSPVMKKNSQMLHNSRNQNQSFSDRVPSISLLPVSDVKMSVSLNVIDSHCTDSSYDFHVPNSECLRGCEGTKRCPRADHHKTRSCSGALSDIYDEDFHLKRLFLSSKIKSTFSNKLFSAGKPSKGCVSTVGGKLDSCSNQHHNVDHSEHIKCFKSKKTLHFLGKNGQLAFLEGIRSQAGGCEHGSMDLPAGSCP